MQNSFTRKRNSGWNENEESSKKKQKPDDLQSFINLQNKEGESPLHIAVANKNIEECKFFLEKGANANLQNCEGKTTLHVAAQQKTWKLFSYFFLMVQMLTFVIARIIRCCTLHLVLKLVS